MRASASHHVSRVSQRDAILCRELYFGSAALTARQHLDQQFSALAACLGRCAECGVCICSGRLAAHADLWVSSVTARGEEKKTARAGYRVVCEKADARRSYEFILTKCPHGRMRTLSVTGGALSNLEFRQLPEVT